jgi:hypothetical protein
MTVKGPTFWMMEAMMNNEQFEARMRDEVNALLESWFIAAQEDISPDETYSEDSINGNLESFTYWIREQLKNR